MATTLAVLLPSRGAVASCVLVARLPWGAFLALGRLGGCGRALGRLCATFGLTFGFRLSGSRRLRCHGFAQVLDALPDPRCSRRPVLELFDRVTTRQAFSDGHQPLRRPTGDDGEGLAMRNA